MSSQERNSPALVPLALPGGPGLRRSGTMLFDQQMWCWGRDVVRPDGNVLCAYGFVRRPPPRRPTSTSGYALAHASGPWVALWGWGMLYGDGVQGGLFLRRYDFSPVWLDVPCLPEDFEGPENLPALCGKPAAKAAACLYHLFPACLRWVAAYERWVQDVVGLAYRQECVSLWHKPKVPAADMPAGWEALAGRAEGLGAAGGGGRA